MGSKPKDITGQRFGRLVAIENTREKHKGRTFIWKCKCDCGNEKNIAIEFLKSGKTNSCGCISEVDITGERFGKLIAIKNTRKQNNHGSFIWECTCDCGEYKKVDLGSLRNGNVRSCGCLTYSEDITGERFGKLVAVRKTDKKQGSSYLWLCKCDCGNESIANTNNLKRLKTQSCGCEEYSASPENVKKAHSHIDENERKEGTVLCQLTKKISKNNTSGVKGVSWNGNRGTWIAHMMFKGEKVLSKSFANKQDAINARKEAEEKYFKPILEKYGRTQ